MRRWAVWSGAAILVGLAGLARGEDGSVTPRHVSLVTVTDTSAVFTWETDQASDAVVRFGMDPDRLEQSARSGTATRRFHVVELENLRPGTTYHYICSSGGVAAGPTPDSPGSLTTLEPPPGKHLFTFATLSDIHVGEEYVARLVLGPDRVVSPGVQWREEDRPLWELAVGSAIEDINRRGVAFTIIKGDIAHGGDVRAFPPARRLLDRLAEPYHVVRGNHDQRVPFLRTFELDEAWYGFEHEGVYFVVLDTELFVSRDEDARERQFAWLAGVLREQRDRPVMIFVHRPIPPVLTRGEPGAVADALFEGQRALAGRAFGDRAAWLFARTGGRMPQVPEAQAGRLAGLLREHGRVAGVFAGHLHRNYVGTWPEATGNMPYVESASTKEYPCGYTLTRVHAGGYMHNFHPVSDADALEWSAMTREAYARLGWHGKAGSLEDRSFVLRYEDLDLAPGGE